MPRRATPSRIGSRALDEDLTVPLDGKVDVVIAIYPGLDLAKGDLEPFAKSGAGIDHARPKELEAGLEEAQAGL